ncbi:regulatory protein, luxR family [Paraburkholderia phenazinium]|uniref:Regulatory protein, luxR family n=2 Tax=Paraburkholderia phenazinium TaxID=60549 RepID=A0A1G7U2S0_9BURK|nr:regulatory protein, luxR family [Paraburkholderia phenazinium]
MSLANPSLTAAQDVAAICKDLFRKTEINCFSYSRVYKDGSRAELWSDADALEHTFCKKKYIVGAYTPDFYGANERYAILESKIESFQIALRQRYAAQLADQRVIFDHASPFKIINKCDEYCEYFIFYSPASRRSAASFYINNLDIFENFLTFFRIVAVDLISVASSNRLIRAPAEVGRTALGGAGFLAADSWSLPRAGTYPLTGRQLEIAQYVIAGQTSREIAHRLGLSARTVETHIDNMRSRLGCVNKTELVVRFSHLGMIQGSVRRESGA